MTSAGVGGFTVFEGAQSWLIHDDEVSTAVEVMQPGTIAALIVFENTWAAPFVSAAMDAGGELIASRGSRAGCDRCAGRLEAGQSN